MRAKTRGERYDHFQAAPKYNDEVDSTMMMVDNSVFSSHIWTESHCCKGNYLIRKLYFWKDNN